MPYSIMLDAGHGGERDPGAVYNGRQEKDDNLKLVLEIGEILQNNGIDVEYTRTTDVYLSPIQRARMANESGVDFFVSIHRNSSPMPNQYMGVESLVYDLSGIKVKMAENINAQLETVGFVNLGVKARPNLVVLRRTQMPAVLVEVGFLNSDTDNKLFDDNFEDIAQAVAEGIMDTLGVGSASAGDPPERVPDANMGRAAGAVTDRNMPGEEFTGMPEMEFRVQTGAFRNSVYAERLLRELTEQDFPAYIDDRGQFDRVQVGSYRTLDEAVQMERRLKRAGYQTVIVSVSDR